MEDTELMLALAISKADAEVTSIPADSKAGLRRTEFDLPYKMITMITREEKNTDIMKLAHIPPVPADKYKSFLSVPVTFAVNNAKRTLLKARGDGSCFYHCLALWLQLHRSSTTKVRSGSDVRKILRDWWTSVGSRRHKVCPITGVDMTDLYEKQITPGSTECIDDQRIIKQVCKLLDVDIFVINARTPDLVAPHRNVHVHKVCHLTTSNCGWPRSWRDTVVVLLNEQHYDLLI